MIENKIVIGITFGDNDFYYTFKNLLENIASSSSKCFYNDRTKTLKVINDSLYAMYRLYQNPYKYNNENSVNDEIRIKEYLKVRDEDFLFGYQEVDSYCKDETWNNSETFILDMRLPKEQHFICI